MGVVIVSGGTFGIGQAITVNLARRGHQIVSFGLTDPQISSVAQGIESIESALKSNGASAHVLEGDVTKVKDVQRIVEHTLEHFGRIDGLINNAAIGPLGTILDTAPELFDKIIGVNLKGVYLMSRAVLPRMIENGGGSIINIGSGAGWGKPNMAAYAASKGGVIALTMAMAYDHFHQHVRVNAVIPGGGGIISGMSVGRHGGDADTFKRKPAIGTVAGRPANGTDVANAIAFLLSEESVTISGTIVDVGCFSGQGGPVATNF